jgi:WD40 repeat protein
MTGIFKPILWDARTGKEIATLRGLNATHYPVAFSPDSARIVAGDQHGTVNIYDTETGKETLSFNLPGERVWITSVAFSSDGKCLTAQSGNDPPVVWLSDVGP